jgi:5'(3')-deoxyribonucleotidase
MIYDNQNKTITMKRLVLRLFQESDAVAVTKLCNNYNIYKNTLYLPYPYSIDDTLSWIEHHLDNFNANKSYVLEKDMLQRLILISSVCRNLLESETICTTTDFFNEKKRKEVRIWGAWFVSGIV